MLQLTCPLGVAYPSVVALALVAGFDFVSAIKNAADAVALPAEKREPQRQAEPTGTASGSILWGLIAVNATTSDTGFQPCCRGNGGRRRCDRLAVSADRSARRPTMNRPIGALALVATFLIPLGTIPLSVPALAQHGHDDRGGHYGHDRGRGYHGGGGAGMVGGVLLGLGAGALLGGALAAPPPVYYPPSGYYAAPPPAYYAPPPGVYYGD
jgi:hypothetical protein